MTAVDVATSRSRRRASPTAAFGWNPRAALILGGAVSVAMLVLNLLVAIDAANVVPEPLRLLVALAGAVLVPGLPVVVALRIPGRALAASLTVSISLATLIVVTQFTMVAEWWNPLTAQMLIAIGSLAGCIVAERTLPRRYTVPRGALQYLRTVTRPRMFSLGALVIAVALFVLASTRLDFLGSGHFGIVTQIGVAYWVGFAVLAGTIAYTLTRTRVDHVVMALSTLVLIAYTTMLVPAASGETSVPTAFVHRGFVETLVEAGRLPNGIDARFSWAGFFSAGAHLVTVADLSDVTVLLSWSTLFMGVLLAFPLYAIAISITGRARLAWLSVVLYQLFNWYQQDYFAPQAVALVFYTTIIATLLWQLRRAPLPRIGPGFLRFVIDAPRRTPGFVPGFGTYRTLAIGAVLLLLIVANVVAHQITPILVVIALAFFSLFGMTRYRTLWLAAGLVFAAWFSYGATDFWFGHLQSIFSEIGQVGSSVNRGVSQRIAGDPTYQQMQYLRMGASGLFAGVAFLGWLFARGRRTWLVSGAICAAPFSLVLLQSYGGEMIIRCFVLASPVLAPFVAIAVAVVARKVGSRAGTRAATPAGRWTPVVAGTLALLAVGVLLTTNRGLNTAFEASTREQVEVSDQFVAKVPPNSTVMAWSYAPHTNSARRVLDSRGPRFSFIDSEECTKALAACALERSPSYLYTTSQGSGMLQLQYGLPRDYVDSQVTELVESGRFVPMVEGDSITILRRFDSPVIEIETP